MKRLDESADLAQRFLRWIDFLSDWDGFVALDGVYPHVELTCVSHVAERVAEADEELLWLVCDHAVDRVAADDAL